MKFVILMLVLAMSFFNSYGQTAEEYYKIGKEKYEHKEYEDAILEFDSAIHLNPATAKAYFFRADSKQNIHDSLGSHKDFVKANELDHNFFKTEMDYLIAKTYFELGIAMCDNKDFQQAIGYFNKALELDKTKGNIYYNRASAKAALEDSRGAILDYNQAIKLQPKFSSYYCSRGLVKAKLKDNNGAIDDLNKAISLNPALGVAYHYRGLVKIIMGQKNVGCLDLSKAGELGEDVYDTIKEDCQ